MAQLPTYEFLARAHPMLRFPGAAPPQLGLLINIGPGKSGKSRVLAQTLKLYWTVMTGVRLGKDGIRATRGRV